MYQSLRRSQKAVLLSSSVEAIEKVLKHDKIAISVSAKRVETGEQTSHSSFHAPRGPGDAKRYTRFHPIITKS
jgi:hypothetical protein